MRVSHRFVGLSTNNIFIVLSGFDFCSVVLSTECLELLQFCLGTGSWSDPEQKGLLSASYTSCSQEVAVLLVSEMLSVGEHWCLILTQLHSVRFS